MSQSLAQKANQNGSDHVLPLMLYRLSRSQHGGHGVQRNWVRQGNHSEVQDGQQTLKHVDWT